MKIGPNKIELWGSAFGIVFYIGLLINIISDDCHTSLGQLDYITTVMIAFCVVLLTTITALGIRMYSLTTGISIDNTSNKLTITYLFKKTESISVDEMDGYTTTRIRRRTNYDEGIMLYMTNGNRILLSDTSLKDYRPVVSFLEDNAISARGAEKFSFFKYYFRK